MKYLRKFTAVFAGVCLLLAGAVGMAQADNATTEAEAFRRLIVQAATVNDEGPLGPGTTVPLSLEQNLVVRQIQVVDGADADWDDTHWFNVVMDGSGRFILFSRIDGVGYAFALDAQRRPTAAAVRREGQTTPVTIDSVRPQLHRMIAFWIAWAGKNAP